MVESRWLASGFQKSHKRNLNQEALIACKSFSCDVRAFLDPGRLDFRKTWRLWIYAITSMKVKESIERLSLTELCIFFRCYRVAPSCQGGNRRNKAVAFAARAAEDTNAGKTNHLGLIELPAANRNTHPGNWVRITQSAALAAHQLLQAMHEYHCWASSLSLQIESRDVPAKALNFYTSVDFRLSQTYCR